MRPFGQAALGRFVLEGKKTGYLNRSVVVEPHRWGEIECPRCFKISCVEFSSCSAVEACLVRQFIVRKRAGQFFMPAAEKLSENSNFLAECANLVHLFPANLDPTLGHGQSGSRPVLILSQDVLMSDREPLLPSP